jgi:hypothetical protein
MIHLDATLGEQLFDVPVRKPIAQVPTHRQGDHLRREPEPGETRPLNGRSNTAMMHQPSLPEPVIRPRNSANPPANTLTHWPDPAGDTDTSTTPAPITIAANNPNSNDQDLRLECLGRGGPQRRSKDGTDAQSESDIRPRSRSFGHVRACAMSAVVSSFRQTSGGTTQAAPDDALHNPVKTFRCALQKPEILVALWADRPDVRLASEAEEDD